MISWTYPSRKTNSSLHLKNRPNSTQKGNELASNHPFFWCENVSFPGVYSRKFISFQWTCHQYAPLICGIFQGGFHPFSSSAFLTTMALKSEVMSCEFTGPYWDLKQNPSRFAFLISWAWANGEIWYLSFRQFSWANKPVREISFQ